MDNNDNNIFNNSNIKVSNEHINNNFRFKFEDQNLSNKN